MAVPKPVGCFFMYLHVPGPQHVADPDFGFQEIRSFISVGATRREHFHGFTLSGDQFFRVVQSLMPDKM